MQTVTLEFRTADLALLGLIPPNLFDRFEEVELLETLRLERGWRLQLLRVRRRGPLRSSTELERESRRIRRLYGLVGFELVERRPRTRDYIIFARQSNVEVLRRLLDLAAGRITPTTPFLLTAERLVASFHGEEEVLRRVLQRLRREGLPFELRRASGRPFQRGSGELALTGRQRSALAKAWMLGYYSVPRRVTLTRLARVTGQSPPALGKMLRRAEGHLVAQFLAAEAAEAEKADAAGTPPAR